MNTNETDRDAAADAAKAEEARKQGGPEGAKQGLEDAALNRQAASDADVGDVGKVTKTEEGEERVTQTKHSLGEALAGQAKGMDDIGTGSIAETAPAVRAHESSAKADRVVQQGDDVVVTTRNPINTSLENPAKVLKINQDGTIAVRIPQNNGAPPIDMSSVSAINRGDGSPFFVFAAPNAAVDGKRARA